MTKNKTKLKVIQLNPAQVAFLKEEMVLLLDADDFPLDQRLHAAAVYKKLVGRITNEQGN